MVARSVVLTLLVIALGGVAADAGDAVRRSRTHREFLADIVKFPYAADGARVQRIRAGVPALQHCMTAAQVVGILGEPDFAYIEYREGTAEVPDMKILTYVLAQQAEQERETDQRVIVWMGMPDELRGVSVWGVGGLTGIDGSASMRCH